MRSAGLNEFKQIMADFRRITPLTVKGVIAAPLIDLWTKAGPPPTNILPVVTFLVELLALIWVCHFWYNLSAKRLKRRMGMALLVFVVCMIGSIALIQKFTVQRGRGAERIVVGYSVRTDIEPLLRPDYSVWDAFRETEKAESVWTKESIDLMSVIIQTVWALTFAALTVFIGTFVMAQRRLPKHSGP
jgi:hypothetical protein